MTLTNGKEIHPWKRSASLCRRKHKSKVFHRNRVFWPARQNTKTPSPEEVQHCNTLLLKYFEHNQVHHPCYKKKTNSFHLFYFFTFISVVVVVVVFLLCLDPENHFVFTLRFRTVSQKGRHQSGGADSFTCSQLITQHYMCCLPITLLPLVVKVNCLLLHLPDVYE